MSHTFNGIPNWGEWMVAFNHLFKELETQELHPKASGSFDALSPLKYQTKGEASYRCNGHCARRWNSINGYMGFEYRLTRRNGECIGDVTLQPEGQKCKRCQGAFIKPCFTAEAIDRVLTKLLRKVKEKFYEDDDLSDTFRQLDLNYKPEGRGQHDAMNCEACSKGKCQSNGGINMRANSRPYYCSPGMTYGCRTETYVKWYLHC